jgi:hypothetical protein
LILAGTASTTKGAISEIDFPVSQLSLQNKVVLPFPTRDSMAI